MTTVDREWFTARCAEYAAASACSVKVGEQETFPIDWNALHPCDDREGGAIFDAHYARCDLWAASRKTDRFAWSWPESAAWTHVDVGSRVDGFCTHVLSMGSLIHVDVRDPGFEWSGFEWRRDDARTLSTFPDGSVRSLSCLHAAEHCGLGRYGDEIDPDGMRKCMTSLARILAHGGRLYFAVPVGRHRVCFNAHRIASPSWVRDTFTGLGLTFDSFSVVDDAGKFHEVARISDYETANYACGMFVFTRPEEIGL